MSELIRDSKRISQAIAFDEIKSDKIHPTDIDAVLEFDDTILILFELKIKGNKVPYGQRLCLERIAKNWIDCGKKAWVIYAEHNTHKDDVIYLKDCGVFEIWNNGYPYYFGEKRPTVLKVLKNLSKNQGIEKFKL